MPHHCKSSTQTVMILKVLNRLQRMRLPSVKFFAPNERVTIIQAATTDKLNTLENYSRKKLLKRKLYADDALPPAMFPMQVVQAPSQAETSEVDST